MMLFIVLLFFVCANSSLDLNYPDIADSSAATLSLTVFVKEFFKAKTAKNVNATMAFFHPDVIYIDSTLGGPGWTFDYNGVLATFTQFMPFWGNGKSYPTRILGSIENGAMIAFVDTPELFGGELRLLGSLSFKQGKIVRWIDSWDFRSFDNLFGFTKATTQNFFASTVHSVAKIEMVRVVTKLTNAFSSGNATAAIGLFSSDAVFEDNALRNEIQGSIMIGRFFSRALATLPYGVGSSLQLTRGTKIGGGYEFKGSVASHVQMGNVLLVLDNEVITRMTVIYDASLLPVAVFNTLVASGVEPPK